MAQKRKLAKLHIQAKLKINEEEKEHEFFHLVDEEKAKIVPKDQMEKDITERLKKVSPTPTFGIYQMLASFSYVEANEFPILDYANVFVEARIPYCLHLPNGIEMKVNLPEKDMSGLVYAEKVWTKRAQEEGKTSSDVDFYMEDGPIHFQKSTMITPKFPIPLEDGWDQCFTGTNIEKMKDQNGTFRYTRLAMEFEPNLSKEQMAKLSNMSKEEGEVVLKIISDDALAIVNRIIDCYRYVTRQEYIERLGALSINTIYFKKENQGFYIMGLVPGIESAVMNRSKKEIDEIERLLKESVPIPLHDLLILDSHSAFQRKAFTLAVVESFQALEIMLENYLITAFVSNGTPQQEYEKKMNTLWKTKDRLNIVLKEVKGHALNEDSTLWEPWHTKYDKVRNEVIHQGKQVSEKDTKDTMEANEAVIGWIERLK